MAGTLVRSGLTLFIFIGFPGYSEQPLAWLEHLVDSQDKAPKKQFILSPKIVVYVSTAPGMKGRKQNTCVLI
jgi:hypothetical protein